MTYKSKLEKIQRYIFEKYLINFTLDYDDFFNQYELNFKNNKFKKKYKLYLEMCPNWGFAPNEMLVHYSNEYFNNTGSSGASVYKGLETIESILIDNFGFTKSTEKQISIFDLEKEKA